MFDDQLERCVNFSSEPVYQTFECLVIGHDLRPHTLHDPSHGLQQAQSPFDPENNVGVKKTEKCTSLSIQITLIRFRCFMPLSIFWDI